MLVQTPHLYSYLVTCMNIQYPIIIHTHVLLLAIALRDRLNKRPSHALLSVRAIRVQVRTYVRMGYMPRHAMAPSYIYTSMHPALKRVGTSRRYAYRYPRSCNSTGMYVLYVLSSAGWEKRRDIFTL